MTTAVIDEGGKQPAFLSLFWRYVAIAVLVWTAVVGGSLVWNFHLQDEQFAELAHKEAVAGADVAIVGGFLPNGLQRSAHRPPG